MKRFLLAVFLLGCNLSFAASVTASDSAFDRFMHTTLGAGQETVSFGKSGVPVLTPSAPTIGTQGGAVTATRSGSIPLPGGAKLPVTATAKVANSAVAATIKKALPYVVAGTAGFAATALTSLAVELGYRLVMGTPSAPGKVEKANLVICENVDGCVKYAWNDYPNNLFDTPQQAADFVLNIKLTTALSCSMRDLNYSGVQIDCVNADGSPGGNGISFSHDKYPYNPASANTGDYSKDLADAIAHKTGWPDSSAIAEALAEAQRITGDTIPTQAPQHVTGPATVKGPTSTSNESIPNGTRETTKDSNYNCTYVDGATVMDGGTVACTEKVTTTQHDTVTDPATGTKTETTTQTGDTTSTVDTSASQDTVPTDTDLPSKPSLYTRKYPDGLVGVWNAKKAELLATPLASLPKSLQPTIAAPGGYPQFRVAVVVGHWNFGTYDISPAPYVWDFIKLCVLICTGFLCRALIFGG